MKKDQIIRYSGLGNIVGVETLIKQGIHPDVRGHYGMTALMAAVKKSQYDIANLLIKYGANSNLQADCGDTALMIAVRKLDLNMVLILVSQSDKFHTIDINIKNNFGESAIDYLPKPDEVAEDKKEIIEKIKIVFMESKKLR